MMLKSKNTILTIALVAITALAIGVFTQQMDHQAADLPKLEKAIILPAGKPLSGIDFLDHNGQVFSGEDFKGFWSILFFGFTNCPDVCPATMHTLKQVKETVSGANRWGNYQVVMVSVDPERDSPRRLSDYVPFFDREFIGLTGALETTEEFARQLGILFVKHETNENGSYDVDHGTALILLNPQSEMVGVIPAPHDAGSISRDLISLAEYYAADHQSRTQSRTGVAADDTVETASSETASSESDAPLLEMQNAWIRPAPPGADAMAGYFELVNNSSTAMRIINSESPQFSMTMIHDTVLKDGVASMQHRNELVVPANGRVSLSPMATHVMMVGPESPLPLGSFAEITLILDDGRRFTQSIEVRPQPK
ncbi:MAG: copper chaperone PCu(A)C [Gammaproteobacteria bacterium]|nr:copper chaperone PCu(A)C [Gammaproteobacteria bacterium]